ncbi:hypothetical protein CLV63_11956 [Murinocardiopsis flavida]|uniref:YCII-related domain-containing protein n=2 Tax=Murinocardiopsis flavida TaxID=645275 RepID=A0A2P8D3I0_9ACTN|nr:hypothetical protein CLV63_11956 [Murinocardiopsis flavida]
MRFMMIIKSNEDSEAGVMPTKEEIEAMGRYNEEMVKAGVMLAGEGLHPSSAGARVSFDGGKPSVTDGPFTESKELVAGFWLIQVKSKEEAVAWASRCPAPQQGPGGVIEIRQVFETTDFPEETLSPEEAARQNAMRADLERKNAGR